MNFNNQFLVSPTYSWSGGLALLWNKDIDLQIISSNPNFIDILIAHKAVSFHSMFIYGVPDFSNHHLVWTNLPQISSGCDSPMYLTRDFNSVLDNSENSGGP